MPQFDYAEDLEIEKKCTEVLRTFKTKQNNERLPTFKQRLDIMVIKTMR